MRRRPTAPANAIPSPERRNPPGARRRPKAADAAPSPSPPGRLPTSDQLLLRLWRGDLEALRRALEAALAGRRAAPASPGDAGQALEPPNASAISPPPSTQTR